ncbi:MAG: iron-sulfur cluster assembly accessory protein [Granulosicoccus sp.]|nr:iron-sulfur cluster assembly accessory protein [Granulosicoccus sp.]
MITVSKSAAKQIKASMPESDSEGMALRLAAKRLEDGSIDYAMGFDHSDHNDSHSRSNGIEIVVGPTSTELLANAELDYVEMDDGEHRFIFINPNDPSHTAPAAESDD